MNVPSCLSAFLKKFNAHSVLALAGITGPLVLGITDTFAAITQDGYNPVTDSISSLALTNIGWIQTIGFLTIGLLVEIFVAGLLFNIRGTRGFHLSIGLLVLMGFGLLLVGAFHTDPVGVPDTTEGIIHNWMAFTVFWLFPIAALLLASSLKQDRNWKNLYGFTLVTGILGIIFAMAVTLMHRETISWFGLLERLLVINMIVWVEAAAVNLLCLSLRRRLNSEII